LSDVHQVELAAVVYHKITLSDELLDSTTIRYGDKAGYLIVLQDKAVGDSRVVESGPERPGIDRLLNQKAFGYGRAQLAESLSHAPLRTYWWLENGGR
jgi:hypothetical protein